MTAPPPDVVIAQHQTAEGATVAHATRNGQVLEMMVTRPGITEYDKVRIRAYMKARYLGKPDYYRQAYAEGLAAGIRGERNRRRRAKYKRERLEEKRWKERVRRG